MRFPRFQPHVSSAPDRARAALPPPGHPRWTMANVLRNVIILGIVGFLYSPTPATAQTAPVPILDWQEAVPSKSPHLLVFDAPLAEPKSAAADSAKPLDLTVPLPFERPADSVFVLASLSSSAATNPHDRPATGTKFRWWPSFGESLLYTGIMHTFNLATEPGTRDALNGPWFKDYIHSVGELRGWSDNDKFMAPYVGHPIEGSIFGFIERQNDPKFKQVQLGDGRDYWVSLLRSMAFSAAWHTQWKIGPISEASIGNVMLHASPGFITLVDTPTLGFCTMLAEDAADRYLIVGLENRSTNRALIILARSFLNPGRTFANIMAFKPPWNRNTRMGLFGENYEIRKDMVKEYKEGSGQKLFEYHKPPVDPDEAMKKYPLEAPIELTAYPYYETFLGGGSCVGGGGSGAARVNPQLQVVAEVSGCLIMHMPAYNISGDSLFYGGGVRWTPLASHHWSPYTQVLIGGRKVTQEVDNPQLREQLMEEWNNGSGTLGHYPMRSAWSVETSDNGPSLRVGGGLDWVITRPFAWRLINLEYTHTWINSVYSQPTVPAADAIRPQNSFVISTQAVVRIGTW
jgi:hypothetical protein